MAAAMWAIAWCWSCPSTCRSSGARRWRAFGAEIVLTPQDGGMEMARDVAEKMRDEGKGVILDQFANPDNPLAHYESTGPGDLARYRRQHHAFRLAAWAPPARSWAVALSQGKKSGDPDRRLPADRRLADPGHPQMAGGLSAENLRLEPRGPRIEVSQADAEDMTRRLAREEGIFAGVSSGGAMWSALQISAEVTDAVIVTIICDRGDRYLSTGIFPA